MTRSRVWRSLAGLAAVVLGATLVTVVLLSGFGQRSHLQTSRRDTVTSSTRSRPAPANTPTATAGRLIPGTLLIPKIGVSALIELVAVDSNNDMSRPAKPTDVGWYSPGVAPGQAGDAVIDGHLDWYGMPKAVFYYLDQLKPGDDVEVISQTGVRLRFKVTDSSKVANTAHPAGLFAIGGPPRLTLITCAGEWNARTAQYMQRLLVNASYVGIG